MFRPFAASALTAALVFAAPLAAQTGAFSAPLGDEDRAALRSEIRAYLMEHPEVIFEAVAEYEQRTMAQQADMDATLVEINADDIYADGHSWIGGNVDGDITLVEFMDYRCSFCRRAFPHMMDFTNEDGNVRLVIKELPILGPQSEVMSRFAVAVLQLGDGEQYFAAHERLMAWEGDVSDSALGALAAELGLDSEAVMARMRSSEVSAVLAENRALAQRLQISGTPSFVIGIPEGPGELLRGFLPAEELHNVATQLRG
ncbi:DsbA family protein [Pararhodobacter sp.]|uniref:DsbA family protein n=1 Tax=Pararhodobacter sp. TaxID=2127056 RepID=UPI002FDCC0E0